MEGSIGRGLDHDVVDGRVNWKGRLDVAGCRCWKGIKGTAFGMVGSGWGLEGTAIGRVGSGCCG